MGTKTGKRTAKAADGKQLSNPVLFNLRATWARWWDFVRLNSQPDKPLELENCTAIHERLLRFSDKHPNEPKHVKAVLMTLAKGKHLVEAAIRWENPIVGPEQADKPTRTDQARGEQWQLVMAYAGWETVREALVPIAHKFTNWTERIDYYLRLCEPPGCPLIPPPNRERAALEEWLECDDDPSGKHQLLVFLCLENGDAKTIRDWMVNGQGIDSWPALIQLAKALRNATAHGALSASKVNDWGLRKTFRTLSMSLGEITAGAFRRLAVIAI
jgi:hypothetical protein